VPEDEHDRINPTPADCNLPVALSINGTLFNSLDKT
jgi:hypothetical protein